MLTSLGVVLVGSALGWVAYTFVGYPLILWALPRRYRSSPGKEPQEALPLVSLTVPVYNEEQQIRGKIECLLGLDYPEDRRQILIVSDASTDGTDDIVREYADRGVELLRVTTRGGKTAAENAARKHLRGDLVLNTDASIRIHPSAARRLVACFKDPTVGVASGRDISVPVAEHDLNVGEGGYVGYEMWVRDLETRTGGIVGASGCLYMTRRELHQELVPEALSRDFSAALIARENGFRSVSVSDAIAYVPRSPSLRKEYRRKVRTVTRGMETLYYKSHLLNPRRDPLFAWKLFSHKVCRWMVPWMGLLAVVGLALLAPASPLAAGALLATGLMGGLGLVGWMWPEHRRAPMLVSVPAFLGASFLAIMIATIRAGSGELDPIWEPTRREPVGESAEGAEAPPQR